MRPVCSSSWKEKCAITWRRRGRWWRKRFFRVRGLRLGFRVRVRVRVRVKVRVRLKVRVKVKVRVWVGIRVLGVRVRIRIRVRVKVRACIVYLLSWPKGHYLVFMIIL